MNSERAESSELVGEQSSRRKDKVGKEEREYICLSLKADKRRRMLPNSRSKLKEKKRRRVTVKERERERRCN